MSPSASGTGASDPMVYVRVHTCSMNMYVYIHTSSRFCMPYMGIVHTTSDKLLFLDDCKSNESHFTGFDDRNNYRITTLISFRVTEARFRFIRIDVEPVRYDCHDINFHG